MNPQSMLYINLIAIGEHIDTDTGKWTPWSTHLAMLSSDWEYSVNQAWQGIERYQRREDYRNVELAATVTLMPIPLALDPGTDDIPRTTSAGAATEVRRVLGQLDKILAGVIIAVSP